MPRVTRNHRDPKEALCLGSLEITENQKKRYAQGHSKSQRTKRSAMPGSLEITENQKGKSVQFKKSTHMKTEMNSRILHSDFWKGSE